MDQATETSADAKRFKVVITYPPNPHDPLSMPFTSTCVVPDHDLRWFFTSYAGDKFTATVEPE